MLQTLARTLDYSTPASRLAPLNRGLIGWWHVLPLRMGGARWLTLVGADHGTLLNMAPSSATIGWGPTTRQGGRGELRFDAASSTSVDLGLSTVYDFPDTTFTVALWVKASAAGYLIARRGGLDTPISGGWFLRLNTDGTLTARIVTISNTSAGNRATVSTTLLDGAWHHVLVVFTTDTVTLANNDLTIYHNGVLDQGDRTDSGSSPYSVTPLPLVCGALSDIPVDSYLTGALDDIRITQGMVTAAYAQTLYRVSRLGYPEDLTWTGLPLGVPTWAPPPVSRVYRFWRKSA